MRELSLQEYVIILTVVASLIGRGPTVKDSTGDANGKKVAVQLDLEKYGDLWEDIQDGLVAEARRHEQGIPFDVVKASLVKSGKLKK